MKAYLLLTNETVVQQSFGFTEEIKEFFVGIHHCGTSEIRNSFINCIEFGKEEYYGY